MSTKAADANVVYKNFDGYMNIRPLGDEPEHPYAHLIAEEKIKSRQENSLYTNSWFLLVRGGEYSAQIEMAMSQIYNYFLGYAPDIDIVRNQDRYYVASRAIKNFKSWYQIHQENPILINGYTLYDNGTLEKDGVRKKLIGLGGIAALTEFFADADVNPTNFGIQEDNDEVRVFKIDNEAALDFEDDKRSFMSLESILSELNEEAIIHMTWYQNEKNQMLKKIAETDFSVIENILRKYINASCINMQHRFMNKFLDDPNNHTEDTMTSQQCFNVDGLIEKLKIRYDQLTSNMSGKIIKKNLTNVIQLNIQ